MSDEILTYDIRVSGLWNTRHEVRKDDQLFGVLNVGRDRYGRVVSGRWNPEKGEVIEFRRDPGMLRAQFSMWTENREWLGSSLRWNFLKREVEVNTGSRPYRLIPLPGFGRGWRLCAPKTGEMARFQVGLLGRSARVEVYRRMDFELLLFAWFLGRQALLESFWPGPRLEEDRERLASASQA